MLCSIPRQVLAKRVFKELDDNGLVVNRKKCILGKESLEFLGYTVDKNGVTPLGAKVDAIRATERPQTIKELQRFLGMINYYKRFIPKSAAHLFHLYEALKSKPKHLEWTKGCDASFSAIKEALAQATMLCHPRHDAQLAITADASKIAIGAVLEQRGSQGWEPLGFFSAKLQPNQREWPPFDRELLAAFKAIRHFRHMVEGRRFTLYTDHQSLVPALSKKSEPHTARQTYQLSGIAEFTTDIRYLEGKANVVADALSRPNGVDEQPGNSSNNGTAPGVIHAPHAHPGPSDDEQTIPSAPEASSSSSSARDLSAEGSHLTQSSAVQEIAAASPDFRLTNSSSTQPRLPAEPSDQSSQNLACHSISTPSTRPATPQTPPVTSSPSSSEQETPRATHASSNSSSTRLMNRSIPGDKLEDLEAVVSAVLSMGVDLEALARDQTLDADFQRLCRDPKSSLDFRRVDLGRTSILVDVSNGPARPFVPFSWRRKVFESVHNVGHPGIERTRQAVTTKFIWPSMKADVARWTRECIVCQRSKVTRHVTPPIGNFVVPNKRFAHLHADLVMVPNSNGFSYLFTIVDRFTRWPMAIPLRDIATDTVMDALAHNWISLYGVPKAITTDRGSQFTSALWAQLLRSWGIEHMTTTAYHPEANGLVERLHRRMKESLVALCEGERDKWFWRLPCAMLSIRTTLKPDVGASPADLVYGEGLALPGELLSSQTPSDDQLQRERRELLANLRMEVERLQPTPTSAHRHPRVYLPQNLATATHVFVRRGGVQPPLMSPYEGPYRVAGRTEFGMKVHLPGRGVEEIALARIKPAHVSVDEEESNPQDLDGEIPPSPPPPGRRPGWRTRPPSATTRVTRQEARNSRNSIIEPTRVSGPELTRDSREDESESEEVHAPHAPQIADWAASPPPSPPRVDSFDPGEGPSRLGGAPSRVRTPSPPPSRRPLSFSKPSQGNFSRRRRPDLVALKEILQNQLNGE